MPDGRIKTQHSIDWQLLINFISSMMNKHSSDCLLHRLSFPTLVFAFGLTLGQSAKQSAYLEYNKQAGRSPNTRDSASYWCMLHNLCQNYLRRTKCELINCWQDSRTVSTCWVQFIGLLLVLTASHKMLEAKIMPCKFLLEGIHPIKTLEKNISTSKIYRTKEE